MRECPECGGQWPDSHSTCPEDGIALHQSGADPNLGLHVGSYQVTRLLGRGGMGAVYEARHPSIGSRVAVKFLHRRYASDPVIVERFFNEARAVNLIGHDNIVHISDFTTLEDGTPYFIMEFLEGQPLAALADRPQPLSVTGPIFLQVIEALLAAHEKGIIHRDLKPDNIFLVTRGRRANFVKVVDFGIAKLQGGDSTSNNKTRTGMVLGTAQYMSPEQAGGEVQRISPASDVYSLGVIMFQLATGRLPFNGTSFGEVLVGHLVQPPPKPSSIEPGIPPAYETLILRCLSKAPEERYPDMDALYEALGAVLDAEKLSRDLPLARVGPRSDPGSPRTERLPVLSSSPPLAAKAARPAPRRSSDTELLSHSVTRSNEVPGHTAFIRDEPPQPLLLDSFPDENDGTPIIGSRQKTMFLPGKVEKKKPWWPFAAIAAGLLLLAGGAWALLQGSEQPPRITVSVPEPPPPPPPSKVEISFTSSPSNALLILLQGEQAFEVRTPALLSFAPNEEVEASLSAEGHETLGVRFVPSRPEAKHFELKALPARPPPPAKNDVRRRRESEVKQEPLKKEPETAQPTQVGNGLFDIQF